MGSSVGLKINGQNVVRKLINRFGGTSKETSTVIGVKDGAEVTRLTLSYRKPAFSIRDVMRHREENWVVVGWQKDGPILGSMKNNQRTGRTWRDMQNPRLFVPRMIRSRFKS